MIQDRVREFWHAASREDALAVVQQAVSDLRRYAEENGAQVFGIGCAVGVITVVLFKVVLSAVILAGAVGFARYLAKATIGTAGQNR